MNPRGITSTKPLAGAGAYSTGGDDLTVEVYKSTKEFPKDEMYARG